MNKSLIITVFSLLSFEVFSQVSNYSIIQGEIHSSLIKVGLDSNLQSLKLNNEKAIVRTANNSVLRAIPKIWNGIEWQNSIALPCQPGDINGCPSGSGPNNYPTPPNIVSNILSICSTQNDANSNTNFLSAILTATGCLAPDQVFWYKSNDTFLSQGLTKTVSPSSTTSYYATCKRTVGAQRESAKSNMITITVVPTPSISPQGVSVSTAPPLTAGTPITLTAVGCLGKINWKDFGNATVVETIPLETKVYKIFCFDQQCKGDAFSINLAVVQPTISAIATNICYNPATGLRNSIDITMANCVGTIRWNTFPVLHAATITVQPSSTFEYFATCTPSGGISVTSNKIKIEVLKAPTITKTIGINRNFYNLNAGCDVGKTVLWSTGATSNQIQIAVNSAAVYTAYCKENSCSSIGTNFEISNAPSILSNSTTICEGQTLSLTATGCEESVEWESKNNQNQFVLVSTNNPYNTHIPTFSGLTSKSYRARCTDGNNSLYSTTLLITINNGNIPSTPTISTIPNPAIINLGNGISLTSTGCAKNQTFWTTGENIVSLSITPTETTTYSAYCFNGTCPSSLENKTVNVVNVLPPIISALASTVCQGQMANLTSSGCNGIVQWFSIPQSNLEAIPTNIGSGLTIGLPINSDMIFYSKCSDQGVVSENSNQVLINYSPNPTIVSSISPASIFDGDYIELSASGCKPSETYLWDTSETTSDISHAPEESHSYSVKCVNQTCSTNGRYFYVKVCPFSVSYPDFTTTPEIELEPNKVIFANNKITNNYNNPNKHTTVSYTAFQSIELQEGFIADTGSVFTAQIGGCPYFIPTFSTTRPD